MHNLALHKPLAELYECLFSMTVAPNNLVPCRISKLHAMDLVDSTSTYRAFQQCMRIAPGEPLIWSWLSTMLTQMRQMKGKVTPRLLLQTTVTSLQGATIGEIQLQVR